MIQQLNVNKSVRREFPHWNSQGRIKKVDESGNVLEGQYAFNGELVRISPRFQRNGTNYRVRPEHPAAFFAAFLSENGLLPTTLTQEECEQEWTLELLDPLWEQYKGYFFKLESPYAACDLATTPNHRIGFSFNVMQVLVEEIGSGARDRPRSGSGRSGEARRRTATVRGQRCGAPTQLTIRRANPATRKPIRKLPGQQRRGTEVPNEPFRSDSFPLYRSHFDLELGTAALASGTHGTYPAGAPNFSVPV